MKTWRRLLAGVLACLLCMSLAGCDALDEARANHGLLQPDGSVRLGNVVYKPLPACEQLYPELDHLADVSVTAPDVPVLLANMLGSSYYKSTDGVFLIWQYDGYHDGGDGLDYCREDRYEEIVARIAAGFKPDGYCYEYEYYDEENLEFWAEYYYLTEAQRQAVQTVYTTVVPSPVPEEAYLEYDYYVELRLCSKDLLMQEYSNLDICVLDDEYYLVDYTDGEMLYRVPVTMYPVFKSIMKAYVDNEMAMYDEYLDEEYGEKLFL